MSYTCPACNSTKTKTLELEDSLFSVCQDCAALFVPETREVPALQLCDDCAWRPGSPEREDPWKWLQMIETTIEGGQPFYCHKGLTCQIKNSTLKYLIPEGGTEAMTPCAGWRSRKLAYDAGAPVTKL